MEGQELKEHRKKLEAAINDSLTDSPRINAAIEAIRGVGYNVFLIIEATIGFNPRDETSLAPKQLPAIQLELTTQDEKFLKSLKIAPK